MTPDETEAKEFTDKFISEFINKFGTIPKVFYNFKTLKKAIDLRNLERAVNNYFKETYPMYYTDAGIRRKNRKGKLILMRQLFYKLSHEMGYNKTEIGIFLGFDHATVIHGINCITKDLEEDNAIVFSAYHDLTNIIANEPKATMH